MSLAKWFRLAGAVAKRGQPAPVVKALRDALADARKERDHWRALAEELRRELSEFRTAAMAAPRRRWWWRG